MRPGYSPAPYGPTGAALPSDTPAMASWVRKIVDVVNNTLSGHLNATASVTLMAGATSTTIIDARITAFSALLLSPLTADAAAIAGSIYVGAQQSGQATLIHTNTANIDCLFTMAIIG